MKKSELRSLIREQVKAVLKEASYKPSDDEFIEEWISMELGDEGDAVIDKTIENVKEEWKEAAVNYPNVRAYLMDLRKNGGLEGLGESKINEVEATNAVSIKQILKNSFGFKRTPKGGMLGIPLGNNNTGSVRDNSVAMRGIASLVKSLETTTNLLNITSVRQPETTSIEFAVTTSQGRYDVKLRTVTVRTSLVSDSSSFWIVIESIKKSK